MKILPEERDFGMMRWRLLSREVDEDDKVKCEIYVLPIIGAGTYMRTILHTPEGPRYEDPVLLKNALVLELVTRKSMGSIVDASGQAPPQAIQCLNREIVTVDVAKKRFQPKGHKGPHADLEIVPGALLTQEQRMMPGPSQEIPPEIMKKLKAAGKAGDTVAEAVDKDQASPQ
jgi:hypothetical protein